MAFAGSTRMNSFPEEPSFRYQNRAVPLIQRGATSPLKASDLMWSPMNRSARR